MIQHPTRPIAVHTWDWKEQPNWEAINETVNKLSEQGTIQFQYVETGSDEHCIVISVKGRADGIRPIDAYKSMYDWEEGIASEQLDWKGAEVHLENIRQQYFDLGVEGISTMQMVVNPLFTSFSNGERTKGLFDEIMKLK